MGKELISIIVPIYNVSKYLDKCLNSLINQTYKNIEIILINDGSTDNSISICLKYKKKDNRIRLYNKKNGGLSSARNMGIKYSKGNYLFFVDSDDFLDLEIIEYLYNKTSLDKDIDIVTCMNKLVYKNKIEYQKDNYETFLCTKEEALEKLLYQDNCLVNAWGKLYKKELFKNILYPEGIICEDLATTYLLFSKARKIVIDTKPLYYYVIRQNSIINSKFDKKRMISLDIVFKQTKFIKENYPNLLTSAINREFQEAIYILLNIGLKYKKEYKILKKVIKKNRKIVLFDKKSLKKLRIYAFISYLGIINIILFHKLYCLFKRRIYAD